MVQSLITDCASSLWSHKVETANLLQHRLFSPWGYRSCQKPARLPTGSQSPSGIHVLHHGSSPVDLYGLQESAALPWSTQALQGIPAPVPPATPPSLALVSAGLFFSLILTPLFSDSNCCCTVISPSSSICYLI